MLDQVREELDKAISVVLTAKRLLNTGTMIDLQALEGRIAHLCEMIGQLEKAEGTKLLPAMEQLINDLDALDGAIRQRIEP